MNGVIEIVEIAEGSTTKVARCQSAPADLNVVRFCAAVATTRVAEG